MNTKKEIGFFKKAAIGGLAAILSFSLANKAKATLNHFNLTYEPTPSYVEFYGAFQILNKDAKTGDELGAFVKSAEFPTGEICIGKFTVNNINEGWYGYMPVYGDNPLTLYKEGALANERIELKAWDLSERIEYPIEIKYAKYGLSKWTSPYEQIRVDINAIPEPSTIALLGLGSLALLRLGNKKRSKEQIRKSPEPATPALLGLGGLFLLRSRDKNGSAKEKL